MVNLAHSRSLNFLKKSHWISLESIFLSQSDYQPFSPPQSPPSLPHLFSTIQAQLDRRREIVAGDVEPTDEDADWSEEADAGGAAAQLAQMLKQKVTIEEVDEAGEAKPEDVKGVPDFWLTAMKNVELLGEMVQSHDEPVLKHLTDIRVRLFSGEQVRGEGAPVLDIVGRRGGL